MTVHFEYDKKLVIQALRYHFISRKEIRAMIIIINAFAILTLALYLFKVITPAPFLMSSFMWVLLMASYWFFLPFMVYKRAQTFQHSFSVSFDDRGFELSHQNGTKSWEWSALSHSLETPHFFHFYFDSKSFFLIPKANFSEEQTQEMRRLLREKVKNK